MEALIVASTINQQRALTDMLHSRGYDCAVCSTASEARRFTLDRSFDLFVINGGLCDERGNELASFIADTCDCGGVYIDEYAKCDMFSDDLAKVGVIALVRPISKSALSEAITLIAAANARVKALKEKNDELLGKLDDMKYISRAKIVLMRSLGYTEEQAHKYIEKKSMDLRTTRKKVAMDILKTYED